ncbi:conserved Plasmodium protein, unknown function [Plasmodium vinckei lentum]|uniref:Uncharacterized protein n=1 Tax=Plasmodium vinckei lentum TaxID=138297 RepID=A0A6V7SCM1_PLAVN|nr:conserved Plasmodium protein, unknown function [Plasmodium vinckei lentum]
MNELKELSKKIKENTTAKKEEKKNESEIKNLFDNFLGNNSINYLSSFINKTNVNENSSENTKNDIRNIFENINRNNLNEKKVNNDINLEQTRFDKKYHNNIISFEKARSAKEDEIKPQNKLKIEKKEENKYKGHSVDSPLKTSKNIGNIINVKKVLQNTKNVDIKDLDKLINRFNNEIVDRTKKLEIFIDKNKIKNDYNENILMLENLNKEMKVIETSFKKNDPLYELYMSKKEKKKMYCSLLFLKNFFTCLKNFTDFLDKSEQSYKQLKIGESLMYLRNCKTHFLVIKYIFKYVKNRSYDYLNEDINEKGKNEMKREENTQSNEIIEDISKEKILASSNDEKFNINKPGNKIGDDSIKYSKSNSFNRKPDKNVEIKLMDEIKKLFIDESMSSSDSNNNKVKFIKETKCKYEGILNNLKNMINIIFNKMFVFDNNIKIYKYIYLNGSSIFSSDTYNNEEKITYDMFWYFAYILKKHNYYLKIIKNHLFFNIVKLMVLYYCITKNLNPEDVINNIPPIKHINSLTYKNIKKCVSDVIEKIGIEPSPNSYFNYYKKYKSYIFSEENEHMDNIKLVTPPKKEIINISWCDISLNDYIVEKDDFIFIDIEKFFNCFILSSNSANNEDGQKILKYGENSLSSFESNENRGVENDIYNTGLKKKMHRSNTDNANINKNQNDTKNNDDSSAIGVEKDDFFLALSKGLLEFYNIAELLFSIKKDEKKNKKLDIDIEGEFNIEELVNSFNFYFENMQNGEKCDKVYFNEYEYDFKDTEEKLCNIKEKLKRKYEYIKNINNDDNVLRDKEIFPLYILNKELNENMFLFFHEINMKRNNLKDILNVYYIYKWKQEEDKFYLLNNEILKNNFFHYLNYAYSILNDIFLYKDEQDYILIDEKTDNYLLSLFFDNIEGNNYNLKDIKNLDFEDVLNWVEKNHILLKDIIKEETKKMNSDELINNKGRSKNGKDENNEKKKDTLNERENILNTEDDEKKNTVSQDSNQNSINIMIKTNNIDCIHIHKKILFIVFEIYQIIHFSINLLLNIQKEKDMNSLEKKNMNENKIKYIISINLILFCYKVIKYIYNLFLSYSYFIFRFSSVSNLNNKEFLLCIINNNIFLKKIFENIYDVYLNYKELFNFYINQNEIIFEMDHIKKSDIFQKQYIDTFNTNMRIYSTNLDDENKNKVYNNMYYEDRITKNKIIDGITNEEKYNRYDDNKSAKINLSVYKDEFLTNKKIQEIDEKKNTLKLSKNIELLCVNKISIFKNMHLYIDKFYINLENFKNMFVNIYKEQIYKLLKQNNNVMEDNFLIHISKIANVIFDFFQIRDLCKSIHKDIILRIIDYLFYHINQYILEYILEKTKLNDDERNSIHEKFIFIQNSLSFILEDYKDNEFDPKNMIVEEENTYLKISDDDPVCLISLKKNRILFLLLFCKIKYILSAKKTILELYDTEIVHLLLSNNLHVCDDEKFDAIINEFI